jgi:putative ABC transport system permease protein
LPRADALLASLLVALRRDPRELVEIGLEALSRYKLRTALSVLGVVLGVAAVIAMTSVSEGARRDVLHQVELMGLGNVVIRSRPLAPAEQAKSGSEGLTTGDAFVLRETVPGVRAAAPVLEEAREAAAGTRRRVVTVLGVGHEYGGVLGLAVRAGRALAPLDLQRPARVCVLGGGLARALFGPADPVGEVVRLGSEWFRVVGVLADRATDAKASGALAARDLNQAVLVPLSALAGAPLRADPHRAVSEVWIRAGDPDRVVEVARASQSVILRRHRGARDVEVVVPRELLDQRMRTQRTFRVVVGSVAALSLLVGGIGIMNVMLASVLERTHEIGIRRTVGATRRDVTLQFLVEALLMTLTGGTAGLLLGVGASWAITAYAGWSTHLSLQAVVMAVVVSAAVGLTFGIYPATRAARLDPIDALRYE